MARKRFWSCFFETLPDDPDAELIFDSDWDEDEDDEDDAPDETALLELLDEDAAQPARLHDDEVEQITWEDGEPVVTTVPLSEEMFIDPPTVQEPALPLPSGYVPLRSAFAQDDEETVDAAYVLLAGSFAADEPVEAADGETEAGEAEPVGAAEAAEANDGEAVDAQETALETDTDGGALPSADEERPETDEPAETDAPVGETEPAETDEPAEMDEPVETDEPAEMDEPVETDEPVGETEPAETDAPEETDAAQTEPPQTPCVPLAAPYAPPAPDAKPTLGVGPFSIEQFIPAAMRTSAPLPPTYVPLGSAPVEPVTTIEAPESSTPLPPTYVPLGSAPAEPVTTIEAPEPSPPLPPTYVPLGSASAEPVTTIEAPESSAPLPPTYVPLGSAPAEPVTTIEAPESSAPLPPTYVPLGSAPAEPVTMAEATYAPIAPEASQTTVPPVQQADDAAWHDYLHGAQNAPRGEEPAPEAGTPIRLFDDEDDEDDASLSDTARRRGQTTRLFKTGTSATTRIHINETEEAVRRGEAVRRAQARAEKRKQDAAAERRSKQKKRSAVIKGLFANIAFVLFFIAAVLVALYYGFLLSEISVEGNERYSKEQIVEASGLKPGTHMLLCNLDEAEAKIEENPYLQVDSIVYGFPNRIRIMVTERKEVAGIAGLDYDVVIDDQGYVLAMPAAGSGLTGLLQVSGISMTGFRLGQRLGEGNDFGTATLIEIIGKLEEDELIDDIASVDLTRPLAITMRTKDGLTVHVGQGTDLDNKMTTLARLLPRFAEQSITAGTLYLSAKGGAVYSPPNAAANAQPIVTDNVDIVPPADDPNFVDDDGDGLDDVTGEPRSTVPVTPMPGTTPTPTPAPTAYVPGGAADDFSG